MPRILLLGGTSEASALARALAERGEDAVFSYAGRTKTPNEQPLPTRVGGFGGVAGLTAYLQDGGFTHVIDATHPFAAQMSHNAVAACGALDLRLVAFERPAWRPGPGDVWTHVPDLDAALAALPDAPARIFLAIGKQSVDRFAARPEHHYLLRLIDPAEAPLPLPRADAIIARGPFAPEAEIATLRQHRIELIVAKNSGGQGPTAKLTAARALQIPVILIDRPGVPDRRVLGSLEEVLAWLDHSARLGV